MPSRSATPAEFPFEPESWFRLLREEFERGNQRGAAWAPRRARPAALRRRAEEILRRAELEVGTRWVEQLRDLVRDHDVPVDHPRQFGHFNPDPLPESVLARALAGAMGSQLAVRPFAPAALAFEEVVLDRVRQGLGFPSDFVAKLAAGGSEAFRLCLLAALQRRDADFAAEGLRGRDPVVYRSTAGHLSLDKALRATGLGERARHRVATLGASPSGDAHREVEAMNPEALVAAIAEDRDAGREPLMIVATLGTTVSGACDPIEALLDIAVREKLWLHVDAAWAGAAAFSPALRSDLGPLAGADSFQVDLHKWPGLAQSLGLLLLRDVSALEAVTRVESPDYFSRRSETSRDPFQGDLDWSRPWRGPEILAALVSGKGIAERVAGMCRRGQELREHLRHAGWQLQGQSLFPIACFRDPEGRSPSALLRALREDAAVWISEARLEGESILRACITSHRSDESDLRALVEALDRARTRVAVPTAEK
jgi:aromatic-L-amino-acid/L-tryptophan decarboxylase